MKTTLPAIQAEQVEDDVAPLAAEYVPAKGIHEGKKARTWGRERKAWNEKEVWTKPGRVIKADS